VSREQKIIKTFVELADTMVDDFDVVEFLHHLAERCVELLDCAEAGLLLADPGGALRVMASSSERSDTLDLLQTQNEEGPCFECFHRGQPILSENLETDISRWSQFAPAALHVGFRSVHAIPMRVRGATVGALNLFRAEAGRLVVSDVELAQGMADIAAIALLQERAVREAHGVVEQLEGALTSRVVIEQAKGIVAEQAQVSVDIAFTRLRSYARAHNLRLSQVARDVTAGKTDATALERGGSAWRDSK
jgi:GAF domain-containing protein